MANYLALCNSTGTVAWRVWPILRALEAEGHQTHYLHTVKVNDDQYRAILEWADVIIFQMIASDDLLKEAKKRGIYTIFDCDDLIDEVPDKHPQFKATMDKNYQRLFRRAIKAVDLVTVSTQILFDHYRKYTPKVAILPNYLPDYFWERPFNPNQSSKVRFGWAGGISHVEDLEFIAPIVKKTLADYPDSKFVYTGGGGWDNNRPDKWRFGEDLFAEVPYSRKEFSPGSKIEVWPDCLNGMRLDVALAPLQDNRFNHHKSHIKYFEYAINSWPGVYQEFLYKDVVKHGYTGYLATTPAEWEHYIHILMQDKGLREAMGNNARRDVRQNYTFDRNRSEWLDLYRRAGATAREDVR